MQRDFEIASGIYLVQPPHELDLHNNFRFDQVLYSIADRTASLHWRRSVGEWVAEGTPASVRVEFREVSEFRFYRRDSELPFTEDDCLSEFGFWTDEDWARGILVVDPPATPDPSWLTAVGFMSGAVIAIQAASAHADIKA